MAKRLMKTLVKGGSQGPVYFRGWKEWKKGDFVVGKYLSSYKTTYRGNTLDNYKIEVIDCNFKIDHETEGKVNPVGKVLVLNAAGSLNKFMQGVSIGMDVEIEYAGKVKGENDAVYHSFSTLEAGHVESDEEINAEDLL
jgi:hypothetical protein